MKISQWSKGVELYAEEAKSKKSAYSDALLSTPYTVTHDGATKFTGSYDQCYEYLMNAQGQSTDYAIKHGGWAIEEVK